MKKNWPSISRKILFALFFSCIVFLAIVFRHHVLKVAVEEYLNYTYPIQNGWKFSYQTIGIDQRKLYISDLKVEDKNQTIKLYAERFDILCKWEGLLHFDLSIKLENPRIEIEERKQAKFLSLRELLDHMPSITIDMEGGELLLKDKKETTSLFFTWVSDEKRRLVGTYYLSALPSIRESAEVCCKIFRWPEEKIAEIEFEDASLPWLSKIASFFQIPTKNFFEVKRGVLNGHFWIGCKNDGFVSQINAAMHLREFLGCHEENGLEASLEEFAFDFSYPSGKKSHNEGDVWWQNIALKSQIVGGKARFKDEKTAIDFSLCDLSGNVNLSTFKDSEILLKGYLDRKGLISPILLSGNPSVVGKDTLDFDLKLLLEPEFKQSAHLNLSVAVEEEQEWIIRGKLKDMGIEQIAMFQHILAFNFPEVKDFELSKGKVTCEISLRMKEGRVEKLLLDNLEAENLQVYWASRDILGFCAHLEGGAQLDFHLLPKFQFPTWNIKLKSGDILMGREKNEPICLSDINFELFMCRDVFEPSWVTATYKGMHMHLDVVGYYPEADIKMYLEATGDRLLDFFMKREASLEMFEKHLVHTELELHRQLGYWDVSGNIRLDVNQLFEDKAEFSFYLSDRIYKFGEMPPFDLIRKSISKGSFKAKEVSCEFAKFINYSLDTNWFIEGIASFEGVFDGDHLDFDVETSRIQFFSQFADMQLNDVVDVSQIQTSIGNFHYDFTTKSWQGFIPLYHAELYEKWLDVKFSDSRATLYIDENEIRFEGIKTEALGIQLEGDVDLSFHSEKGPLLKVEVNQITSNVKQLETFIHHIKGFEEVKIPIEGKLHGGEKAFRMVLDFQNHPSLVDIEMHVKMTHGQYKCLEDLSIQDLSFNFDFDTNEKEVAITSLQGKIPSLSEGHACGVSASYLRYRYETDFPYLTFDVRVENETMDLLRLKGEYDEKTKIATFDRELSEFLGSHFTTCALELDASYKPKFLDLAFDTTLRDVLALERVLTDMGKGNGELSAFFADTWQCTGDLHSHLMYKEGELDLSIDGKELQFQDIAWERFSLRLSQVREIIYCKELSMDAFSTSFNLYKNEEGYDIANLTIKGPELLLDFNQGNLDLEEKKIFLPIRETFLHLEPLFGKKGRVRADGEVIIDFSRPLLDTEVTCNIDLKITDLIKEGLDIRSKERATLEITRQNGIVVKDSVFLLNDSTTEITFNIPLLAFHWDDQVLQGSRIHASAPSEAIHALSLKMKEYLFDMKDIPRNVEEITAITFDFSWSLEKFHMGGFIDKGKYLIQNQVYELYGCNFAYDQKYLDISLSMPIWDKKFGIHARIQSDPCFHTQIIAFDEERKEEKEKDHLLMECRLKGPDGLSIQKIEGDLFGFSFHFLPLSKMQDDVNMIFLGGGKIDIDKMWPILNGKLKEFADELSLHKGYEIKGELTLVKDDFSRSSFQGFLSGRDFDLVGYQLKTLLSEIHIDKTGVHFQKLKISDDAVTVDIREIKITNSENGDCIMHAPEVHINDLRPSLLKKRYQSYQRLKPFCIKSMIFQDITGNLNDLTTITGKGSLFFINTFKQGHNILDVPIEIISRLGLDMGLLVPIQGEMDYVLRNGRLIFTKLKNSYSENKRSFFYLWNKTESYIDFAGDMHIDIRMKQYVLFKITELFILSIQGSLEQPKFSLK